MATQEHDEGICVAIGSSKWFGHGPLFMRLPNMLGAYRSPKGFLQKFFLSGVVMTLPRGKT